MLLSYLVKLVLFAPFSNIWEHSFPEALIAEGLVERGASVLTVRCGTMLQPHCVAMSAAGVPATASLATRQKVCEACFKRRDLLDSTFPFDRVILDDLVTVDDRAAAASALASVTRDDWMHYELEGVKLGSYAAYEFLLDNKVLGTDIPENLWSQYLAKLEQSVVTFLAGRRMLLAEKPDRILVYNRYYAVNHAFCRAAQSLGIPCFSLQGGSHTVRRAETMTMFRDTQTLSDVFTSQAWNDYAAAAIGDKEVALVREHIAGQLQAASPWAYSSAFEAVQPRELRERFGVEEGRPVLLVAMSSEDEINAVRLAGQLPDEPDTVSLFADQFAWIRYLFRYADEHPGVTMIIRLHPRMYPNKRENIMSPVVEQLLELLDGRPANVVLNLPTDNVSLFDIMQIVDVLLNFRSSAGADLAAFGIPVVVPANRDFFTYPADLHLVGRTEAEYESRIDEALASGWSLEQTRRAFRWFAFLFSRVAIDLSDSVHSRPIAIRPRKPGLRLWLWRKMVWVVLQYGPLVRERIALRNRKMSSDGSDIFFDVLQNARGSLSDSPVWLPLDSTPEEETRLLTEFVNGLTVNEWRDVRDHDSLAGRIRAHLDAA